MHKKLLILALLFSSLLKAEKLTPKLYKITDRDGWTMAYAIGSVHCYPYENFEKQYREVSLKKGFPSLDAFPAIFTEEGDKAIQKSILKEETTERFRSITRNFDIFLKRELSKKADTLTFIKKHTGIGIENEKLLQRIYINNFNSAIDTPIKHILTLIKSLNDFCKIQAQLTKMRTRCLSKKRIAKYEKELLEETMRGRFGYIDGIDCMLEKVFSDVAHPIISVEESTYFFCNKSIIGESTKTFHTQFLPLFSDNERLIDEKAELLRALQAELTSKYTLSLRNISWMPKTLEAMERYDMPLFCFGDAHFSQKEV